ncbi:Hypothetical protein CINCED_3A015298 [Cinara cedri]|uniref:Uncharacterized protein n=1 Tax=Cinara cedri TaxID=506608 RepID=A0A5E4NE87_9HEMI|nr:Hypothetical protein CINCED_3A015298 [Cinara cedri]
MSYRRHADNLTTRNNNSGGDDENSPIVTVYVRWSQHFVISATDETKQISSKHSQTFLRIG